MPDLIKLSGLRSILAFDNWPMLLLGRLFDRKTAFVGYRKDGLDILIDHRGGDEGGTRMCIVSDTYRKYLPLFDLKGPVRVLDLGANGGGFPLMLKIAGVELARVVCVEMNPITYTRLQLNLSTNLRFSSEAINAAVCGKGQGPEILLKPTRGSTGESMYGNRVEETMPHVAVATVTMQELYDRYFDDQMVDICKIDIEGAEYEAFAASSDDLVLKIRCLIMEFHDSINRMQPLLDRILALGFKDITIEKGHKPSFAAEIRVFLGPGSKSGGNHSVN